MDDERKFINTLQQLSTPVDVIATGMAASAGALMLASASTTGTATNRGKRLAMPQTLLLIHEAQLTNASKDTISSELLEQLHEELVSEIHRSTGRPLQAIRQDFRRDYWLNPVEALFYGPKGLIDGIPYNKIDSTGRIVITRNNVERYLIQKMGSKEKVEAFIKHKQEQRRDPMLEGDHFDENDPFDNIVNTLEESAKLATQTLGEGVFTHSGPDKTRHYFEHHNIMQKPKKKLILTFNQGIG